MKQILGDKKINIIFWLIPGYRRFSNIIWFSVLIFAGLGFLFRGISSYFNFSFPPFFNAFEINYVPQGLIMTFYGTLSIILGCFILFGIDQFVFLYLRYMIYVCLHVLYFCYFVCSCFLYGFVI